MTKTFTITNETFEDSTFGPIITKLFNLITPACKNKERQEQVAKDFWETLNEEELTLIQNDIETGIVLTMGLSYLFSDLGDSWEIPYEESVLAIAMENVVNLSSIQSLINKKLIVANGGFYHNPFKWDNTIFTLAGEDETLNPNELEKLLSL